ncbi:MAG: hypothetical protein WA172_17280 [Terriglobales bacterium]
MPQSRLTDTEKKLRGTFQPSRAARVRTIPEIEATIAESNGLIASLTFVLTEAQQSVEKDGIRITTVTRDNANRTVESSKLNPAVRLLLEIPNKIRAARREITLLSEELETALQKEREANEPDEFAGL